MNIQQVLNFQKVYNELANVKLPLQTVYKLTIIAKAVEQDYVFYQNVFNHILEDCAEKDADGQFCLTEDGNSIKIQTDKINECEQRLAELRQVSFAEPNVTLALSDFGEIELTLAQMEALLPFIA